MKKPMPMKSYEGSAADRRADASGKHGKEGSAKDRAADKKAAASTGRTRK